MVFEERLGDLFTADKKYALVHCISADCAMGAGIAQKFTELGVKDAILRQNRELCIGEVVLTRATDWNGEVSLVTKQYRYDKPTLNTMETALLSLKKLMTEQDIRFLAMPKIGSGLDRLKWTDVRTLVLDTFRYMDAEIVVYGKKVISN